MAYITKAEVQGPYKDLYANHVDPKIDTIIAEADKIVNADISGMKEVYQIVNYNPAPDTLSRMSLYKSRELAYIVYYGKVPEGTEIQYWSNEYAKLLQAIRDQLSKIDYNEDTDIGNKLEFV